MVKVLKDMFEQTGYFQAEELTAVLLVRILICNISRKIYLWFALLCFIVVWYYSLRWCHNGHDGISNHQSHQCLLNRLFGCISKKTSKLRVTGLCVGNSSVTGEFPAQMASNAENVSIWWRHHVYRKKLIAKSNSNILLVNLQWLCQYTNLKYCKKTTMISGMQCKIIPIYYSIYYLSYVLIS